MRTSPALWSPRSPLSASHSLAAAAAGLARAGPIQRRSIDDLFVAQPATHALQRGELDGAPSLRMQTRTHSTLGPRCVRCALRQIRSADHDSTHTLHSLTQSMSALCAFRAARSSISRAHLPQPPTHLQLQWAHATCVAATAAAAAPRSALSARRSLHSCASLGSITGISFQPVPPAELKGQSAARCTRRRNLQTPPAGCTVQRTQPMHHRELLAPCSLSLLCSRHSCSDPMVEAARDRCPS